MKLQYLGDSKDSFKWDYHDFLVSELGYPLFNIALMMTPDGESGHGRSSPTQFGAKREIIAFCEGLRRSRSIESIKTLPDISGSSYRVDFHNGSVLLTNGNRSAYFRGFSQLEDQVVFLDPDIGFEPEKSLDDGHVGYKDVARILDQLSEESIVSVFQCWPHKGTFPDVFKHVKARTVAPCYSTAICWQNSLMFVALSKSEGAINRVRAANAKYEKTRPVTAIG